MRALETKSHCAYSSALPNWKDAMYQFIDGLRGMLARLA